ncbi:hypothetical protein TIFTF001_001993 [Ficus carica]|uniref:RING-type domain-containing protein n=1 Tax=Ficus carica TaxID=3494 RepID=A0AA87Z1Z6_FICCA|nr:hypothetical protein TIFTF001_001993 [Ficus carica]
MRQITTCKGSIPHKWSIEEEEIWKWVSEFDGKEATEEVNEEDSETEPSRRSATATPTTSFWEFVGTTLFLYSVLCLETLNQNSLTRVRISQPPIRYHHARMTHPPTPSEPLVLERPNASPHGNDIARGGGAVDDGVLEPEELPLFRDEPAAAPGLDVVAFLGDRGFARLAVAHGRGVWSVSGGFWRSGLGLLMVVVCGGRWVSGGLEIWAWFNCCWNLFEENHPRPLASDRDRSISFFLTDPDVLDCSICFDPLTIPVFQCENGHIACSSCCTKLSHKCPSCSWPIGYNRCRAIEKVLESVKIACQNKQYGCKETVTQLYSHFSSQHKDSAVPFHYGLNFTVRLNTSDKFRVLQECNDGVLFILKNEIEVIGNLVSLSCIKPCSFRSFSYELVADYEGNSLKLESFTKSRQGKVDYPLTVFLLIPHNFFGSSGQLRLNVLIYSINPSPACSDRSIEAS